MGYKRLPRRFLPATRVFYIDDMDKEMLELIADGNTAAEIGKIMIYGKRSVENRIQKLKIELKARSAAHLVQIAYEEGYLIIRIKPPALPADPVPVEYSNHNKHENPLNT